MIKKDKKPQKRTKTFFCGLLILLLDAPFYPLENLNMLAVLDIKLDRIKK
jgi:hypothetical protein